MSSDASFQYPVYTDTTLTAKFEKDSSSGQPQPEENAAQCPWCGGTHEGFFGGIVAWFHSIFAGLFGARY